MATNKRIKIHNTSLPNKSYALCDFSIQLSMRNTISGIFSQSKRCIQPYCHSFYPVRIPDSNQSAIGKGFIRSTAMVY